MAEQLKPHLSENATESVDLDNLFAFLSDVGPQTNGRTNIIDEIGEKMNELVEDLDVELETVIQQELEGINFGNLTFIMLYHIMNQCLGLNVIYRSCKRTINACYYENGAAVFARTDGSSPTTSSSFSVIP